MTRILRPLPLMIVGSAMAFAQAQAPAARPAAQPDHATSYYQYTLAHMYVNLALENQNRDTALQAIEAYKAAIAADPQSALLSEELSEVYIQFGMLSEARTDAEAAIKKNANDIAAHRLLARISVRQIQDQNNRINSGMIDKAVEEFKKVTELDPTDADSWTMLGRLQRVSQDTDGAQKSFQKALDAQPDNEDALVGMASVYLDKNEADKAADMFKRAADKNPSAAALKRLAGTYEQMHEYDLAAETIKKALTYNPPDVADLRKALAEDLVNAGKIPEALEAYSAVAAEDEEDFQSHLRMSQIYVQMGDFVKARAESDKAQKIDPENVEVRYNDVSILQAEGKPKEAITALENILKSTESKTYSPAQRQSRSLLMERLAVMYRMLDQPDKAVAIYRDIADMDSSKGARISAEIIEAYRAGKKFPEAQKEADLAIKRYSDDRGVRAAKASLDADMGRVEAAATDVKRMLDGTDDRGVQMMLAEIYEKGKKFTEARAALDSAEKLSQAQDDKVAVWFMRGALYEKMKNLPLAETEFKKVLGVVPDHAATLNYLGYMLTDRNVRLNEGLDYIKKALEKEPNNGAYLDSLGWAYYRMGRYPEAETAIGRAVALSPGDPTMTDHYAEALDQQKKYAEAVAAWEQALKLWNASAPADKDDAEISKVRTKLDQAKQRLPRGAR